MSREGTTDIHTAVCKQLVGSCCRARELSSGLCDDLVGRDGGSGGAQEGGDIRICIADSLCCTEKLTTL